MRLTFVHLGNKMVSAWLDTNKRLIDCHFPLEMLKFLPIDMRLMQCNTCWELKGLL